MAALNWLSHSALRLAASWGPGLTILRALKLAILNPHLDPLWMGTWARPAIKAPQSVLLEDTLASLASSALARLVSPSLPSVENCVIRVWNEAGGLVPPEACSSDRPLPLLALLMHSACRGSKHPWAGLCAEAASNHLHTFQGRGSQPPTFSAAAFKW